jgi:hypothetical protein
MITNIFYRFICLLIICKFSSSKKFLLLLIVNNNYYAKRILYDWLDLFLSFTFYYYIADFSPLLDTQALQASRPIRLSSVLASIRLRPPLAFFLSLTVHSPRQWPALQIRRTNLQHLFQPRLILHSGPFDRTYH